jgi:Spy/CpxP family protein refolding chaperone
MAITVNDTNEQPAQKEILTPTQKKNLEETKRKYRGALEQLSRL